MVTDVPVLAADAPTRELSEAGKKAIMKVVQEEVNKLDPCHNVKVVSADVNRNLKQDLFYTVEITWDGYLDPRELSQKLGFSDVNLIPEASTFVSGAHLDTPEVGACVFEKYYKNQKPEPLEILHYEKGIGWEIYNFPEELGTDVSNHNVIAWEATRSDGKKMLVHMSYYGDLNTKRFTKILQKYIPQFSLIILWERVD